MFGLCFVTGGVYETDKNSFTHTFKISKPNTLKTKENRMIQHKSTLVLKRL